MKHDELYSASNIKKAIKGMKTSDGKTVKEIDPHVYKRASERKVYASSIKAALKHGTAIQSKTNKDRTLYEYRGTTVIYDNKLEMVKTVIYKWQKVKRGGK